MKRVNCNWLLVVIGPIPAWVSHTITFVIGCFFLGLCYLLHFFFFYVCKTNCFLCHFVNHLKIWPEWTYLWTLLTVYPVGSYQSNRFIIQSRNKGNATKWLLPSLTRTRFARPRQPCNNPYVTDIFQKTIKKSYNVGLFKVHDRCYSLVLLLVQYPYEIKL